MLRKLFSNKKGQGLVEYGLIVAGVALVCAATVSIFGHKTNDLIAAMAVVIPGAHSDDNGPIASGRLIETTDPRKTGAAGLDIVAITTAGTTRRLGNNLAGEGNGNNFGALIVSPPGPAADDDD